jgi:peptidoglycan LD-endopeptidase CwlK
MMPSFSSRSSEKLASCDDQLQRVFNEVIKRFDCSILQGHRGEQEQNEKYRIGLSRVQYPNSKHNSSPSRAVDLAPYPIDWNDRERFSYFAGYVLGISSSMEISLRWGGDWNKDTQINNNNFDDLPHFELSTQ